MSRSEQALAAVARSAITPRELREKPLAWDAPIDLIDIHEHHEREIVNVPGARMVSQGA